MIKHTIERVELEGIHNRYDLDILFTPTLNILFGENGTGKSTLIHIIANVLNCDFIRFAFLEFHKIKITYSNQSSITVTKNGEKNERYIEISTQTGASIKFSQREAIDVSREVEDERYDPDLAPELIYNISSFIEDNEVPLIRTSYFPAFRTMLEALSSQLEGSTESYLRRMRNSTRSPLNNTATTFSRNLFGNFLPKINYPTPIEIEHRLNMEIRRCLIRIANYESSIFSESFVKVFSALIEGRGDNKINISPDVLLEEISRLTNDFANNKLGALQEDSNTYSDLKRLVSRNDTNRELQSSASEALIVYRDALKDRLEYQQDSFKAIDTYFEVVNSFLNKKQLDYRLDDERRVPKVSLKFPDGSWSRLKVMSSGERQLLTMLYAVNRMSKNSVVLIDEPEISLHIDWQENLLIKMMEQLGSRQIIVCTHSPAIASDFTDYMTEVVPKFRNKSIKQSTPFNDEEIDEDGDDY